MTNDMIKDYEHLPLGKYEQILALRDDADNSLAIVGILSGLTEDALLHLPLHEYAELRDAAAFLFYQPDAAELRKEYKVGAFTLIPTEPKDITTAQYIDFKEWCKADGDTAALLTCLLVPKGAKDYNEGYDWEAVRDALNEELPVTEAVTLRNFFTARLVELMNDSLTSSLKMASKLTDKEQRKKMRKEIREMRSLISGVGCGKWMRLQSCAAALGPMFTD